MRVIGRRGTPRGRQSIRQGVFEMIDPLVLPSLAALSGAGLWMLHDYFKRRLEGPEDRYMTLYGRTAWEASNMDLTVRWARSVDAIMKRRFVTRLSNRLRESDPAMSLWRTRVRFERGRPVLEEQERVEVADLLEPRRGVHLDLTRPGQVRVVWNHMMSDGVGMWAAMRPLFDENPPLVPYRFVPAPPPIVPELLAIPSVVRMLTWRGALERPEQNCDRLHRGFVRWNTGPIRRLRQRLGRPFNLVASALVVSRIFERHPDRSHLNVGLTSYFPFLEGRNKYGLLLSRVARGTLESIVSQLAEQASSPLRSWGVSAAQAYALGRLPDHAFERMVSRYRRKIDVLVSSLPVGQRPIELGGTAASVACHPWELTLPYYVLMVGTRTAIDVSYTSRFAQGPELLGLTSVG